jgi:hypothetical protein
MPHGLLLHTYVSPCKPAVTPPLKAKHQMRTTATATSNAESALSN